MPQRLHSLIQVANRTFPPCRPRLVGKTKKISPVAVRQDGGACRSHKAHQIADKRALFAWRGTENLPGFYPSEVDPILLTRREAREPVFGQFVVLGRRSGFASSSAAAVVSDIRMHAIAGKNLPAPHPLSRSPALACTLPSCCRCASKDRQRTPRSFHDRHHDRPLFARNARDASERR